MNIILDLDGTLTYTLEDLYISTNYALRTMNMPERTMEEVRMFVGNGVRRLIEQAVPAGTTAEQFEECFATFKAHYVEHCQDHTRLYDGIPELLRALKDGGHKLAIVSNKLQAGVDCLYDQYFRDTVEVAIGERQGVARKPAPDMVHLAMDMLHATTSDTVYVGDSEVDLLTARNTQIPCISVLWGFRDKDFLLAHGATTFASVPQDILDLLND